MLTEFIEEKTNSIDKKKKCAVGVFVDLKAFDTIDHNLLLIRKVCIQRGCAELGEKLFNRQQSVKIGEYESTCMDIT